MSEKKTHRLVKNPSISARDLAEYMTASQIRQRSIVRNCKFRPIARITQHNEAKIVVSKFIRGGGQDASELLEAAERLRNRMADDNFQRDLLDHNADYIDRFVQVYEEIHFPDAERLPAGPSTPLIANGVKINPDIQFRFRRVTRRTNKVRVGAGVLRYAKGKATDPEAAQWHSAFLFGFLQDASDEMAEPEHKLCLALDVHGGIAYTAPSDSVRRYSNMLAACASIAERWPNIPPPPKCIL